MSFKTFMGSISNAFKTGWNNGNIQKGISATGMAAFTVGMTGYMINDIKNSGSIFGKHCCYNSFGFDNTNLFGYNSYGMRYQNQFNLNNYSPFSYSNSMYMYDEMGILNNGMSNLGNLKAYQWGQQLALQQGSLYSGLNTGEVTDEMLDVIAPANNFEDADGVVADKAKGEAFETGIYALITDKDADAVTISDKKFSEDKDAYIENLKTIANSYIATMDVQEIPDGYVSEDEYIEHEVEKAKAELEAKGEEMTDAQETKLRNSLRIVFAQMDMNRNGKIDWKEMTSTMATYDMGGKVLGTEGGDGKITATEYNTAHKKLTGKDATGSLGSFGKVNKMNYKRLFNITE